MIAIDWGTTSFRAYRLSQQGSVQEKREATLGILAVPDGNFSAALESQVGDWLDDGDAPVLMSGMIGSRQGWKEAPYAACPAGEAEIAARMVDVNWGEGRRAWIVPGLSCRDSADIPDVLRGEETQLLGVLSDLPHNSVWVCLPGTHSKWARLEDRRIVEFSTHMTGEVFAIMRQHSILGRMMREAQVDEEAFADGVVRARDAGGLLHHLFGVRSAGLFGQLADESSASYLSGLLIGHELASIPRLSETVYVLAAEQLAARYVQALSTCGISALVLDSDAVVKGLFRLSASLPKD
ncbi:MAG TPA: 2-dehydro-3-deoxygalactonokinase [Burkholderiales bacterium]|nr:2-dehydro-3-deoxygalactonokinase [Burkholderiales bacterium]